MMIKSGENMLKTNDIIKNELSNYSNDVPSLVYPESIILKSEDGYSYPIATKEKALCDKLYTLKPLKNYRELEIMLFNDLRIDKEELSKLNIETIEKLSKLYHSTNVNLLAKYMKGVKYK